MIYVLLLLLAGALAQNEKGDRGNMMDKMGEGKDMKDMPCAMECGKMHDVCKRRNKGDAAGANECMMNVLQNPGGDKNAQRCAKCKNANKKELADREGKGEKGDMECEDACSEEFKTCKEEGDVDSDEYEQMDEDDKKAMMDEFMECVADANKKNMESNCSKCMKAKMGGDREGYGKCPEGCAETFARNGGCVVFMEGESQSESEDPSEFLGDDAEKCMVDGCEHAAARLCRGRCMSKEFDKSCCEDDSCDARMAYCCDMESPAEEERNNRMMMACMGMMKKCGMSEEGKMPEGEAKMKAFWPCVVRTADKTATDDGKKCSAAQKSMYEGRTCGGEELACMKLSKESDDEEMVDERMGKCMIEMASDRNDVKCGRKMFGENPDQGDACLKVWGACLKENEGKKGFDAPGKCVFMKAQGMAAKGDKRCMDALMKGKGDSEDDSKDMSKDSYDSEGEDRCEKVCMKPYMTCMERFENGMDSDDSGEEGPADSADESGEESGEDMSKDSDESGEEGPPDSADESGDKMSKEESEEMSEDESGEEGPPDSADESGEGGRRRLMGFNQHFRRRLILNELKNLFGMDKKKGENDEDASEDASEDEEVEKNKLNEKINKDQWNGKDNKKEMWNRRGEENESGEQESGEGEMEQKMMALMEKMDEQCQEAMTECGGKMKDCSSDSVDCTEQEEMAFSKCMQNESNKNRAKNPECAKTVFMFMKMMVAGDGKGKENMESKDMESKDMESKDKDSGEGMDGYCPRPCAMDFVENGGCALFGADSESEEESNSKDDDEWLEFIDDDTKENNECTEKCYKMIYGMCMAECKENEMPDGCEEDPDCDYYYCSKMEKEGQCDKPAMTCGQEFDAELEEEKFVNCIAKKSMMSKNTGCLKDLAPGVGEYCMDEMMKCLQRLDYANERFGYCVWDLANKAGHKDCTDAIEADDDDSDDESMEKSEDESDEMDPRLLQCIIRESGGPQSECGKCISDDSRPEEDACMKEKKTCMSKQQTGEKMMPCLMATARNNKNMKCYEQLKKPEQKMCPEGCVAAFKKIGVCDNWDNADQIIMTKLDEDMMEKCMVDACERAGAKACFGECNKQCLMPWMKKGGCAVFGNEELNPMDFMDKEMDDGKCGKMNPTSCEWDAAMMCKKTCMDAMKDPKNKSCPPMKCCGEEAPECCEKMQGMEYCCELMDEDDDGEGMPEGCGPAIAQCARRMGFEEESMDSADSERMNNCVFKVAAGNDNKKCISSIMTEDKEFGLACMKELAMCMNVEENKVPFDNECFVKEMQKNQKCMEALPEDSGDESKASSEEPSSEEPEATLVPIQTLQYKNENFCKKGKKGKKPRNYEAKPLRMGCTMQKDKMDGEDEVYFKLVQCDPAKNGGLMFTTYKEEGCKGAPTEKPFMMAAGKRDCKEDDKGNVLGMSFEPVEECLPMAMREFVKEFDGTEDKFAELCAADKDTCKSCGGKLKKGECTFKKGANCKKVDKTLCGMMTKACSLDKKGKCKGKFA